MSKLVEDMSRLRDEKLPRIMTGDEILTLREPISSQKCFSEYVTKNLVRLEPGVAILGVKHASCWACLFWYRKIVHLNVSQFPFNHSVPDVKSGNELIEVSSSIVPLRSRYLEASDRDAWQELDNFVESILPDLRRKMRYELAIKLEAEAEKLRTELVLWTADNELLVKNKLAEAKRLRTRSES